MNRKIIGIFAIVLVVSSILKLTGLNRIIIDAYETFAMLIMRWLIGSEIFELYPTSVNTLILLMPLIFITSLTLFIVKLVKRRKYMRASEQVVGE